MHVQIEDDGDNNIIKKLAVVGLWGIQWNPINRPSMNIVVQMQEGDENNLTIPPNSFGSASPLSSVSVVSTRFKILKLEVIHE